MTEQPSSRSIELAHAAAMPAPQGGALPTGLEWQALERMAVTLADSNLIPYRLKGKPGDVAVILLAAREYGIPPLMALSKLPVINGQPAPMGELMVALVLRAGHRIAATFRSPDGTLYAGEAISPQHYGECIYRRAGSDADESLRFTIAEAIAANLMTWQDGKPFARDDKGRPQPWELYTPNMARWRAVANACRIAFADVLLGLSYLPEELGAVVDEDGQPIEGEVVPQRAAPTGNLEQRTAQEDADKLAEQPWPDHIIDAVRRKATEQGYVDVEVTYAGERMTLEEALERHVADRQHADTVEAELVEEDPVETVPGRRITEEEETANSVAEQAVDAPEEAASAPQPAEEDLDRVLIPAQPSESPQDAAHDVAREVLRCNDVELLRTYYRGASDEGLTALNVIGVLGDDDLHTLGVPSDTDTVVLGALIMAAGKYVEEHGIAVSDPEPEQAFAGPAQVEDPTDPWADGSGMAGYAPQP